MQISYTQKKSQQLVATTIPYSSGWHAEVNGQPVKTTKIQQMFLGIKVNGAGVKKITLTYRPPYLLTGLIVSLISIAVLIFSYWFYRPKYRPKKFI